MRADHRAIAALGLATIFAALSALHVSWVLRSTASSDVTAAANATVPTRADGTPVFRPGRLVTLTVALALAGAAVLVLGRASVMARMAPEAWYAAGTWMLGVVLLLRVIGEFRYVGIFKRERGTRFAALDTRYYTPLCGVLAAGVLYLALR